MSEIRAFVGHSFLEVDEQVVGVILKYFDQLQEALPSFDWVNAREARPEELAKKVIALMADRNVFIGVCTKRERAFDPTNAMKPWFSTGRLQVSEDKLEWKTSDWIISEIGFAIAREMDLVLLLENGCRPPGGLQGTVEFIPFDRDAPEKAFGPILEMLKALAPSDKKTDASKTVGPSEEEDKVADVPASDEDAKPDGTWDAQKYESAYFWKVISKDDDGAAEIDAAFRESPHMKSKLDEAEWDSMTQSAKLSFGSGGSLDRLKELAEAFPENSKVIENLALSISRFGNNLEAAHHYQTAANTFDEDSLDRSRLLGRAAIQFLHAGESREAEEILDRQRQLALKDESIEIQLLHTLRTVASVLSDDDLEVEAMERLVELKPDDHHSRFSLAYKHSQLEHEALALHHYLKIPFDERSAIAWNNLGVSFQHFSMPAKAVFAYQRAAENGETLAMSNLGYQLMNAGFVDEARQEFDRALAIEDYHKNVGEGVSILRGLPEKESEKEKETLEAAQEKIFFFRQLGKAVTKPNVREIPRAWSGPNCDLEASIHEGEFSASGEYETKGNALSGLTTKTRYRLEYSGKVTGTRIDGFVERKNIDNNGTRLSL
ncbi:MAG: tetratricopeptide repeat protein [Pseudomonadota bacterium]